MGVPGCESADMARSAGLQSDGIFENVDGKIFGPCLLRGNYSFIFISSKKGCSVETAFSILCW